MNLFVSVLRTAVPLLAGWILTVTGAVGIETDQPALVGGVTASLTLAYYLVFRLLELAAARIGWEPARLIAGLLLGWARPPKYEARSGGTVTVDLTLDDGAIREAMDQLIRRRRQDRRP